MSAIEQHIDPAPSTLLIADPRRLPQLSAVFENDRPIEIEVGCGKGKFIIARAQEYPHVNFLGVDVVWKWMRYGVERSAKRGLTNVRFLKADAKELVRHGLPDESISIFHIYFPDPWPKRRHRKRRLVTADFLRIVHSRLLPGGLIELATDHEDYFAQMRAAVARSGVHWARCVESVNARLFNAVAATNYEIKYSASGRTLRYLELQK